MKRRLVVLLIVAVALGSYVALRIRRAHAPVEWSGTVEAHTMEVGSRVGGRVLDVHVREGDRVVAGQPLVTLEKGDLPAQRLIAEGQLEQAQGVLQKVASRTPPTARRAELAEADARPQVATGAGGEGQARRRAGPEALWQRPPAHGGGPLTTRRWRCGGGRRMLRWRPRELKKESLLHGTPRRTSAPARGWSRRPRGACNRST